MLLLSISLEFGKLDIYITGINKFGKKYEKQIV